MKKLIVSACMMAFIATASQAQQIPDRKPREQHEMKRHHRGEAFKNLNLTEEQKTKFKALNEEHRTQMAELKKSDNITVKELRTKMETLKKDHRAKMQNLLTPEQKTQLEKSKQEHRAKMEERSKARIEKMKQTLNLTNEQSAKLKSDREAMQQKIKSIREDQSLNDQDKKDKVKELMKQQKENMRSILTEEQLKKLDEMKQKRHMKRKIV